MSKRPLPDSAIPFQPSVTALPQPLALTSPNGPYTAIAVAVGPVIDRDLHYGLYDATALLCIRADGHLTWMSLGNVGLAEVGERP